MEGDKEPSGVATLLKYEMQMFFEAIERNEYWTVKRMIERGERDMFVMGPSTIDQSRFNGDTALTTASRYGHIEICKLLIENGAEVDTADENGVTALMMASHRGHIEICRLLIEKGADVNATDEDGDTALMIAIISNRIDVSTRFNVCSLLLGTRGINVDIQNNNGYTAIDIANKLHLTEIIDILPSAAQPAGPEVKTNVGFRY